MKNNKDSLFDENLIEFLNEVKTNLPTNYKIPDPGVVSIILSHTQWGALGVENSYSSPLTIE